MNANDKRIIKYIKEFVAEHGGDDVEEKFEVDAYVARLFGIPKTTFSHKKSSFKDKDCDNGIITIDKLSTFFDNVKLEYGSSPISRCAAIVLKKEKKKDSQEKEKISKAIDRKIRIDAGQFKKDFGHTYFAQFMTSTTKPLFICAYSKIALEDMLYMFYDRNSEYKELDLLLNSKFYDNKFEILSEVVTNLITTHQQENGGYNEDLVLNFHKSPASSKDDIYFNMLGLGESNSESESCGLVHDEYDYYELSTWGQDYVYEHNHKMQLLDTSPFLEIVNILPGKNNF
jgi:hypothetical protein